jgi:membrane protease YdiL (CAAX protease family)
MKYFREYPWGMQALLFVLMVFTMMSAASVIILSLLPKLTGFTLMQVSNVTEHSSPALIDAALGVQGFGSILAYLAPAWVFAYLAHPQPKQYLGLRAPGKSIQLLLVVLVMLGAMPVLGFIADMIGKIDFGADIKAKQEANDRIMEAFLKVPSFTAFLKAVTVMAVIPAIAEELFFRGILMRIARQRTRNMVVPIVFTAAIFSLSHSNIYGYLSIFLAGVLLAVIYNLTGSLWCAILAHFTFNGMQIFLSYVTGGGADVADKNVPITFVIAGALVFAGSFYLLLKNKTPLPETWANDFDKPSVTEA